MIQYIVIKQGVAASKVPSITARAALKSYLQWQQDDAVREHLSAWCSDRHGLRVVVANPLMFARLKDSCRASVFYDEQQTTQELALVPQLEEHYPDDVINLPNWYVNA
jgi:hypothetical protein